MSKSISVTINGRRRVYRTMAAMRRETTTRLRKAVRVKKPATTVSIVIG